jgi:hypothetical protein
MSRSWTSSQAKRKSKRAREERASVVRRHLKQLAEGMRCVVDWTMRDIVAPENQHFVATGGHYILFEASLSPVRVYESAINDLKRGLIECGCARHNSATRNSR